MSQSFYYNLKCVCEVFSPSPSAFWLAVGGQGSPRPLFAAAWPDWRRSWDCPTVQQVYSPVQLYTAVQLEAGSDQLPGLTHCNKMQLSAEILPARPPYPEVSDLTWLDLPDKQLSEINKSERELQISPTSRAIFLVSEHAQTRFILSFHPFITGEAASGGKLFTGFFLSSPPHNRLNNYSSNIINTFLFFQWQLTGSDLNPCTTCNLLEKRNLYTYLVFISKFRFSCNSFEAE